MPTGYNALLKARSKFSLGYKYFSMYEKFTFIQRHVKKIWSFGWKIREEKALNSRPLSLSFLYSLCLKSSKLETQAKMEKRQKLHICTFSDDQLWTWSKQLPHKQQRLHVGCENRAKNGKSKLTETACHFILFLSTYHANLFLLSVVFIDCTTAIALPDRLQCAARVLACI